MGVTDSGFNNRWIRTLDGLDKTSESNSKRKGVDICGWANGLIV